MQDSLNPSYGYRYCHWVFLFSIFFLNFGIKVCDLWPRLDLHQADVPKREHQQDLEQDRGPLVVREHIARMGGRCEVLWPLRLAWRTGSHCSSHPWFRRWDVHPIETRGACAGYCGGCWQQRTRPLPPCRQLPRMRRWGRFSWGWVRTKLRLVGVRWLGLSTLFIRVRS